MSLFRLAASNFKRSVREYLSLVIALAFSVFIFMNFQNVIYLDSMDVLQTMNKEYIDLIVQAATVLFGVFLFFFIWYATNVFLNQRKKEIGIYTFMGLDNVRIGKMYALEAALIGLVSLAAGLGTGVAFSKLFQMLLLYLSEVSVDVRFSFSLEPVLITSGVFFLFFGLMILKGYLSIRKSSVLAMMTGSKKSENRERKPVLVFAETILGMLVLSAGFYAAIHTGKETSLAFGLAAVILVIVGVYLFYGGAIPALIGVLTKRKTFLYKKQRTLWINNLSYRIRQNYRTYAMVTVLMISAVTVLAISIAMKQRYEKSVHFRETYTYQIVSMDGERLDKEAIRQGIEEENQVLYGNEIPVLALDPSLYESRWQISAFGLVSDSNIRQAAEEAGLPFEYEKLQEGELLQLNHVVLLTMAETEKNWTAKINGKEYTVVGEDETAYLGDLQSQLQLFVASDEDYQRLKSLGSEMILYNYKIKDSEHAEASRPYLDTLIQRREDGSYTVGINVIQAVRKDETWIRIFYSLCVFMFATLILAGGSIIFIKLNNDAYADRAYYKILLKLGVSRKNLKKAIRNEIRFTYYCPFVLMAVSSWFAVKSLGNVMKENLFMVNVYSAVGILMIFTVIYWISVPVFQKKVLDEQ